MNCVFLKKLDYFIEPTLLDPQILLCDDIWPDDIKSKSDYWPRPYLHYQWIDALTKIKFTFQLPYLYQLQLILETFAEYNKQLYYEFSINGSVQIPYTVVSQELWGTVLHTASNYIITYQLTHTINAELKIFYQKDDWYFKEVLYETPFK